MLNSGGAPLDKIIAFARKWAVIIFLVLLAFVILVAYLVIQFLAKYTLLVFLALAVFAYIKRDHIKALYYRVKLGLVEYQRNNRSDR